jgi:hypothetical protein
VSHLTLNTVVIHYRLVEVPDDTEQRGLATSLIVLLKPDLTLTTMQTKNRGMGSASTVHDLAFEAQASDS